MAVPNQEGRGGCTYTRGGHRDTLTDSHHVGLTVRHGRYRQVFYIYNKPWSMGFRIFGISPEVADDASLFHTKEHAYIVVQFSIDCTVSHSEKKAFTLLKQVWKPYWIFHCLLPSYSHHVRPGTYIQYVHTPSLTTVCVRQTFRQAAGPHH